MNRIVARFQDGTILKGFTNDFLPGKDRFHLFVEEQAAGAKPVEVRVGELKALFFVRTLDGDPKHQESLDASAGRAGAGRRIRVVFHDGEVMVGTTQGYDRTRPGFFLAPVDTASNNERCFVVAVATREVLFV